MVIKKYITDEMLASLMAHSSSVILPYVEASQSGVIPMAYQFKKPVVVSDMPGLTENVLESETGFIFKAGNSNDLYNNLKSIAIQGDDIGEMASQIESYYLDKYDWGNNIKKLMTNLS